MCCYQDVICAENQATGTFLAVFLHFETFLNSGCIAQIIHVLYVILGGDAWMRKATENKKKYC